MLMNAECAFVHTFIFLNDETAMLKNIDFLLVSAA
jgi:hypothetical protein